MRRHPRARAWLVSLLAAGAACAAAAMSGCYTQLATVRPESDLTQASSGDSEEYFAPNRRDAWRPRYVEDELFDPYRSGLSYTSGDYGRFYETPWWWERWYPGGSPSAGPGGAPPSDTDRDLWRSGPPPVPSASGSTVGVGPGSAGPPQATAGAADSSGATPKGKKQPKRRLWK